ncbi:MAG: alpha/beta hydrolase [Proteobacteria bacterium]|nr:alpha/beta hydrolase [Pseudomonadota bacterium]MBU1687143.1 alpha/beta hydrolase [Pseudomonadota bacterium]
MRPIVLIHGYSAESTETDSKSIEGIYGTMPDDLRTIYGPDQVVEIDLSRWISLEDGLTIDDIARGLQRALQADEYKDLLVDGFDVIIHSTGALVIRNWFKKFSPRPSPLGNLIYLAGANLGSGWAHIGKGQLAKWGRFIFQGGAERGVQVLDALEFGSEEALDLHLFFLDPEHSLDQVYQVREHVVIGSQADVKWFEMPIRYAKEDGSDGVIRAAAGNLNFIYCHLTPTEEAEQLDWETVAEEETMHLSRTGERKEFYRVTTLSVPGGDGRAELPFAIPYECAHTGDEMGIVIGSKCRQQVLKLINLALLSDGSNWPGRVGLFQQETDSTYEQVKTKKKPAKWPWSTDPRTQYDPHAQVIFRLRDQDGRPIRHYDIFFDSHVGQVKGATPIGSLIEDKHVNQQSSNCICFYLRVAAFDKKLKQWVNKLDQVGDIHLEISATEPETDLITYLPFRHEIPAAKLKEWIRPHTTTIFDIQLLRLPGPKVFMITRNE